MLSCTSALYIPTASQQTESASLSQLQEGRILYVQKCGSCHTLVLPDKHTKNEWQHFLNEMQQKASINNTEKEQILRYLSRGN
jgi:cytochrome c5